MTIWSDLTGIEFELRLVDAGGIRTRSLQAGTGEHVLFLHGTSGHLEAFTRNVAAHASEFLCHAVDMLGHGYTDGPDYEYTIPRYVEHINAYMAALDIERVHLVGESLGGWVAAWFASEYQQRVGKLILVAPGGTVANPDVMQRIRETTTAAVMSDDIKLTRERLELLMFDPSKSVTDELVETRHRIYHRPEFQRNLSNLLCLQVMATREQNLLRPDRMGKIEADTLIVWSRQNPFGAVAEAEAMLKAIPASELVIFDECGHWPQYEHAERFNDLSVAFLS